MWDVPATLPTSPKPDREVSQPPQIDRNAADSVLLERCAEFLELETWPTPADPTRFRFLGIVLVTGRDRSTRYTQTRLVPICTSSWIHDRVEQHNWTWLHSPLVVSEWNQTLLRTSLDAIVQSHADATWPAFVARMARYTLPHG